MDTRFENNNVELTGRIVSDFKFSHEVYGESFYIVDIETERISGVVDTLPLMVPERLIDVSQNFEEHRVRVIGQLRSFNCHEDGKNRLILSVFVREIEILDDMQDDLNVNAIYLDGYICKEPIYRKTPLGREIADILIAVNRSYGKSDYIPCVCWGRNARFASGFEVGEHMQVCGRIQSREYIKKISETEQERRVVYEVSISRVEVVEDEDKIKSLRMENFKGIKEKTIDFTDKTEIKGANATG